MPTHSFMARQKTLFSGKLDFPKEQKPFNEGNLFDDFTHTCDSEIPDNVAEKSFSEVDVKMGKIIFVLIKVEAF